MESLTARPLNEPWTRCQARRREPRLQRLRRPSAQSSDGTKRSRYRDGMVIWQTPDDDKVPFLLKFNLNTQFRYLNTLSSDDTFTDHLGNVRDVHARHDLTVNRAMFILDGYVFDKRLLYSYTVWTSAGAASIVTRREHWLAIQPGPHDHWRLQRCSRQPITC